MTQHADQPSAGPWAVVPLEQVVHRLTARRGDGPGPLIVAVDGRGGAGKTTLVERLLASVPGSACVHTDDVAWHLSFFDWAQQMREGVLEPLRRGEAVSYRPPGWIAKGRPGAIEVLAGSPVVWLEGTGSSRVELADLLDAAVWIQADEKVMEQRLLERDGPGHAELHEQWGREEGPFLAKDRPWERADVIVAGSTDLPFDAEREIVLGQL